MHRRDLLRLLSLSTFAGAVGCNGPSDSARPAAFSPQTTPRSGFVPDVEMLLTAAPDEVAVLPGAPTMVWRSREALTDRYPKDRAIGFTEREIRGWFWVEVPKKLR
jgi:hypothetical protein